MPGHRLPKSAKGFGLSIHYNNRYQVHPELESDLEATYWESLDQMLARMDFICVNCPHTSATCHLLSARQRKKRNECSGFFFDPPTVA